MSVQEEKLTAIADAIREKEGSGDPIPANDFPARIRAISTVPDGLRTIKAEASDPECGAVTGGGVVSDGMVVTVGTAPADGYKFIAWAENGETVCENAQYTFSVNADRTLVAVFASNPRLPEGYTKVEYIQSTGTQHIDTKLRPSQTMRVDIDIYVPELPSASAAFFGSIQKISTYYIQFTAIPYGITTVRFLYGRSIFDTSSLLTVGRHQISLDSQNKEARYDDEVITIASPYTFESNGSLYLFYSPAAGTHGKFYMYSCQIYEEGTLIRDMVPCKNASGAVGMYDLVNDVFYANSGTGTFIAGPAV